MAWATGFVKRDHRGDAAGLVVLAAFLAVGVFAMPGSDLSTLHWLMAGVVSVGLSIWLWHGGHGPRTTPAWLYLALLSLLLSMIAYGADAGLELVRPQGSRRHDAASTVLGIELYQLLCPGLTAVALAGWVRHLVERWLAPKRYH